MDTQQQSNILSGKLIAQTLQQEVALGIAKLSFQPLLVDVVVGNNPVIDSYVRIKAKRASEVGIRFETRNFPESISEEDLLDAIQKINTEQNVCGIILQLPLPKQLPKQKIIDCIDPKYDVDVITSTNLGQLFTGTLAIKPATAGAILHMLKQTGMSLIGKHVLVIGAGDLVGKPVAYLLIQERATVTIAQSTTKNLKELTLNADIIISGTGSPKLVTADMVREGVVIIDAGTAESASGISGDVDFAQVGPKCTFISPVPGGVGPVTVAMLLSNVLHQARLIDNSRQVT